MTNSKDQLECLVSAVGTDLKIWPRFPYFRQPTPAEHLSQDFVVAFFLSVVIHAFLACILWTVVSNRTAVESAVPTIDTPLIISLSAFTTASHDGMVLEEVSAVPHTAPPAQRSQSSPEHSRSGELKAEDETVVTSKSQVIPGSEAQEDKSPATNATSTFNPEVAYPMAQEFGRMPEFESIPEFERMPDFKAETFVTWISKGVPGSEATGGKPLTACLNQLFGLEAVSCMERNFGRMPESEAQDLIVKSRMLCIKNYIAEYRASFRDCRNAYTHNGLYAIPKFIRDAITDNGCKWYPEIKETK